MERSLNTAKFTPDTVTSVEQFLALREQWQLLLDQAPQNSVFLSWEWHYSWWVCFANSQDSLQIVVIRSAEKIVGIAPLYYQHTAIVGKTLRFIGTGEPEADEVVSEYLDFIALPEYEQAVVDTMVSWIQQQANWQRIEFNNVLEHYLCVRAIDRLSQDFSLLSRRNGKAYTAPLENSETAYRENRLSASRNKRLKRCLKSLDKDGGGLVRKTIGSESEIINHLNILKTLHDERWSSKNQNSIFESPRFMAFHEKLLALLVPQNKASIALYLLNDKPISAVYVLYSQVDCHYYQSGFSKEGENRYMPLLVSHIMEMNAARESGYTNYDFMRGGANSYKSDFGCHEFDMIDKVVYRHRFEAKIRVARTFLRHLVGALTNKIMTLIQSKKTR